MDEGRGMQDCVHQGAGDSSRALRAASKETPCPELAARHADSKTAFRALILLFRENGIPMSDRNSFLYSILEDALAPPPVLQIEALAHRHASRYIHGSSNPKDSANSEYTFNRATLLEFARALTAKEMPSDDH